LHERAKFEYKHHAQNHSNHAQTSYNRFQIKLAFRVLFVINLRNANFLPRND